MASPQVEKGFTRIANELLDALARTRIPGQARQIVDVVIRKTYGFRKPDDAISLSQFHSATGIQKPNCDRAIKKAVGMKLINRENRKGGIWVYSINKDYETWRPLSRKTTLSKMITNRYLNRYPQKKQ